jgi:hypothetical protein
MPSWRFFQIEIWLIISRARRIKKIWQICRRNLAILEKPRGSADLNPRFYFEKSAKACSEKSYDGILLGLVSFDNALLIGVWVCIFWIVVTLKSVAE